jgi:hypothetical protein
MRKATVAAGVLAAGAVFSTAVVDTVVRSPNRNAEIGVVPHGPSASGGGVDRTREVGRAPSADGVELAVVAGLFLPIEPGEADPDAIARGLPYGSDGGPEPSPRSTTSDVVDLAEGPVTEPGDTSDVMGPGGGDRGSVLTVLLPDVRMPVIEVQAGVELDVPIVGTISTPRFAVSQGRVGMADRTVSASHGTVGVGVSESPEVEFAEVGVDRAHLSPVQAAARDIGLWTLPRDSAPQLAIACSTVSGARAMLDTSSAGTTSDEAVAACAVADEEAGTVAPGSTGELLGSAAGSLLSTL